MLDDVGCLVVPFDGYHYPKSVLESFPNSDDVIYRRGAPDTFDASALERDLRCIRDGNEDVVKVPGFDHAAGDPEADAYTFSRSTHKVVICEADVDSCIGRLKIRNKCIP
eukprot:4407545-Ditylum_brightwellii.AAC.1